ncbi:MAG: DUF4277 domain-containing protein [Moorea sp. SIO3I7]|nr:MULTISPECIES: DUF4277 domain-containing protein [unclassified Moorena]NEO01661.1 DUF4277 domain-containing protein [Moorena sp. SIO3I7]NEO12292.1 DUF4277 domain-containing protein [Moorena sp. SIO3E8]NEP98935.1 DUF4277 domain-containing protein [Moorena sp. SIO3F7]
MNVSGSQIKVQDIDHLGIVAGIVDEMGLVEEINQLLGTHPQEIISAGQVVKAMIINGKGFVSAPLYLFYKFFEAMQRGLGGFPHERLHQDRDCNGTFIGRGNKTRTLE